MHPRRRWLALALFSLAAGHLPAAARAQSGFATFQFSFSNPGARSMGLGGAFVALADDATAAFANPAGLVQLLEPEVSVEARSWRYRTPYAEGGRLNGEPSGFGLDTTDSLRFAESAQNTSALSFLSLVYPRNRWSLAFYRHVLSNYEFAGESQGFFSIPFPPDTGFRREADRRVATAYDIVGYGLTGAYRVSDTLSVGLGWVYFDIGLSGSEAFYGVDSLELFFERNSYLVERNFQNTSFHLDDSDLGLIAGLLWRPTPAWRVGAAYRPGPKGDDFQVRILSGPSDPSLPLGTPVFEISSPLGFPDTWSLGVAYRAPSDRLTLSIEWDRVEYSAIVEHLTFESAAALDDADELHLGAELVFPARRPTVAVRFGAWLDPDHRIHLEGEAPPIDRAFFRRGDDEWHGSLGVGVVFRRLQLDVGIDLSDLVDTFSVSTILSF